MGAIELALKHLAELTQKLTVEATNPITTAGEHLEGLRSVISELPLRDRNTVIAHLHELLRQAEAS